MYQNFFKKLKKKYLHENVNYVAIIANNQDIFPKDIKRKEISWITDILHDLAIELDANCKGKSKLVDRKLIHWSIPNNVNVDDIISNIEDFITKTYRVGDKITKFNIRGKELRLHFWLTGLNDDLEGTKYKYYISIEYDRNSVSMSVEKE